MTRAEAAQLLLDRRREREKARASLAEFVRQAWHVLEPGIPLVWNWHLDVMCDALERQARGETEYRKLAFFVPPGTMKSLTVSVFAPAWEWLDNPARRKFNLSNDDKLATRDSKRMRDLITSEWYLALAAQCAARHGLPMWELAPDQNQKVNFENSARGSRMCLSMGAAITGKRADDIVIDDPVDAKAVVEGSVDQVRDRMKAVNDVYDYVLPTRVNDLATARWTLIMQRLHEEDLGAHVMAEGGWTVINLQMEYEPDNKLNHPADPRTKAGELLFPGKFPRVEVDKLKTKLKRHWWSQCQQNPRPGDGGPLKRWYWCFWYPHEMRIPPAPVRVVKPDGSVHECKQMPLPKRLGAQSQSWDMAFKDTKDSAYVVGQVWAEFMADSFLLDQVRDKMDFVASVAAVRNLSARWPRALEKLVEDKANGSAVINTLKRELPGLVEIQPEGGKEARANAASPAIESGNVFLPHPALVPTINALIDECEAFPAGAYADQVDALTQYLNKRYGTSGGTMAGLAQW